MNTWTPITEDDCTFTIECLPEDTPVQGNACASDDEAFDKETEDKIIAELDSGNPWAWCTVKVTAKAEFDFVGTDYLGCCSYANEGDFKAAAGYWEDMKANALADLNRQGQDLCDKLNKRMTK